MFKDFDDIPEIARGEIPPHRIAAFRAAYQNAANEFKSRLEAEGLIPQPEEIASHAKRIAFAAAVWPKTFFGSNS